MFCIYIQVFSVMHSVSHLSYSSNAGNLYRDIAEFTLHSTLKNFSMVHYKISSHLYTSVKPTCYFYNSYYFYKVTSVLSSPYRQPVSQHQTVIKATSSCINLQISTSFELQQFTENDPFHVLHCPTLTLKTFSGAQKQFSPEPVRLPHTTTGLVVFESTVLDTETLRQISDLTLQKLTAASVHFNITSSRLQQPS